MQTDIHNRCHYALEYAATKFSRVPSFLFISLALIHLNSWITKLSYRIILCVLHSMIFFQLPHNYIDATKHYTAWAREWSFTKPSDWLFAYYRYYCMQDRVDVVVAHYKEDLSWVTPYLGKIDHLYLYCKDRDECYKGLPSDLQGAQLMVRYLPNEGREANTYLHHIINYYDELPARSVFTLASLNGNWMRKLSFIFALTESDKPKKYYYKERVFQKLRLFQFHNSKSVPTSLGDGYDTKARGVTIKPAEYQPLGQWMSHYFPVDVFASRYRFGDGQHGAIFSVTRPEIQKFSPHIYQKILQANSGDDSMEAGYYMERIWRFMFATDLSK